MKLTNQQVNALASKIKTELIAQHCTPINIANKAIMESNEYVEFTETNSDCVTIKNLRNKYNFSKYDTDRMINQIKDNFFRSQFKEVPSFSLNAIIDEIHLATIEIQNIDELVTKVAAKFAI